jgi:hypothetical protein
MNDPTPGNDPVMAPIWRHLLFLHWEVDADELRRLLPAGLELDLYEGRAYVGLVPFTMLGVHPRWLPQLGRLSSWNDDFHETNVRTYVRSNDGEPGVWFFSLDAANPLAVVSARTWFKLPYFHARMRLAEEDGAISCRSRRLWPAPRHARCAVRYRPTGEPAPAPVGSLNAFLVERYSLYSYSRGQLWRGRVRHEPYQLQPVELLAWRESMVAAAGVRRPEDAPLACYAREVRTTVYGLERVEEGR